MAANNAPIYLALDPDDPNQQPTEIESMCPNCEENGVTRIMLTRIPHYKDVILMSFYCEHCGCRNNELQSGEQAQEQGLRINLRVMSPADLNRQVVKSEYAGVSIPDVELEIPHRSQTGEITTVEGVVTRVRDSLRAEVARGLMDADSAVKLNEYCNRLDQLLEVRTPWTLIIDDPSGNSYVENPHVFKVDPHVVSVHYTRTLDQEKLLALVADDATEQPVVGSSMYSTAFDLDGDAANADPALATKKEILHFQQACPKCNAPAPLRMKVVDIPYFKECIIMAQKCEACGFKNNEVKSATGIAAKGCRIKLLVKEKVDLARDILKSDTCSIELPDLDVQCGMALMSGRFTTVEGLLGALKEQLNRDCSVYLGDAAPDAEAKRKLAELTTEIDEAIEGRRYLTIILDDPAGNSYIQNLPDSSGGDPQLHLDLYERSDDQNDDLGISDMVTENYEQH